MIRVMVADDHEMVREGLKRVVASEADMTIVDEAGDGHEVLRKLRTIIADVLLLDISMPGPSFLDTLRRLHSDHPTVAVLVVSIHPEGKFAIRALRAGASGYVTKERSAVELAAAIRKIATGAPYMSQAVAERLVLELRSEDRDVPHELLSDREFEVLRMLGSGYAVKEIAQSLSLSPKTVSTYRARIKEKTGLETIAQMVRYVVENELTV